MKKICLVLLAVLIMIVSVGCNKTNKDGLSLESTVSKSTIEESTTDNQFSLSDGESVVEDIHNSFDD